MDVLLSNAQLSDKRYSMKLFQRYSFTIVLVNMNMK